MLADALGVKVGTYIDPQARFWENADWQNVAAKEFNLGVNSIGWHVLIPKQDEFSFGLPDAQVDFASKYNMDVRGQALVYSSFLPDWLKSGSFSRDQLIAFFQKYITTIMNRYKGRIGTWVVVNEAGFIYPGWDFFETHIGQEYVEIAFRIAREADPSARLIYNDFGNESVRGPKFAQTKKIIASLLSKGLIDGVGLQMHIAPVPDGSRTFRVTAGATHYNATTSDLAAAMQSYGLPIHITELDVDLRSVTGSNDIRFGLQADTYKMIIETALASGVCKQITFWGIGDKYSWLEQPQFNGSTNAQPTIFDDELKPKPAYYAVREAMSQGLPPTPNAP
jgi:endo-1,4-beta-xylanase